MTKNINDMKIKMMAYIDNKDIEDSYPDDLKISIQYNNVTTIDDLMNGIKLFAIASGFSEATFNSWFREGV